ncbi:hypothetical protein ACFVH0_16860 [Streptomyces sp. NPDC127117]|uniref:hypothetical protein n=1 Tax=Streptomyces sp. NPDC127117 TaxID=3345368 RepID=UPI003628F7CB
MDPIVSATGTALVSAMAADSWQQVRTATTALWRRLHPEQADEIAAELGTLHAGILNAREQQDHDIEEALTGVWRLRLQHLHVDEPSGVGELRRLLEEHLAPALPPDEQRGVQSIVMKAEARDHARVYMAGRDQHITGS